MHKFLLGMLGLALLAAPVSAQTADEIVAKYIKAVGGMDKIQAVKTLRRSGKIIAGGGFELPTVQENKRPNMFRQEIILQGLTGVTAYNGKTGWKVEPFQGKKDPESLGEDEMKQAVQESDFYGPLVNYQQKGNKVAFVGMEPVEGTDAYKLKVTLADGEVRFYFMDTDYYVPIKIEAKRIIRGAEIETETSLGDYKEVNGWYLPFSIEAGGKGSQFKAKIAYDKIEANVPIDDSRFLAPAAGAKPKPAPGASN